MVKAKHKDFKESSKNSGKKGDEKSRPYRLEWMWFCCRCAVGPVPVAMWNNRCSDCSHQRCEYCPGEQVKIYEARWKSVFTRRQTVVYSRENSRFVGSRPGSGVDIIDTFVDNRCTDDPGRHLSRRLLLGKFLDNSDFELFGQQPDPTIFKPKILLDDRNDESVSGITRTQPSGDCRPFRGPITAFELYQALSEPRLASPRGPIPQARFIAAERRLIYVTDLDPHCCMALAITASPLQAAFLRDFLHRHLACRAAIGVHIYSPSPVGYSTFALEFHLPYYAWRRMDSKISDVRRKGDGTPLRIAEEVIHLEKKDLVMSESPGMSDYIYEAQCSVMVTGLDDWVWTAYCFVDVYFKGVRHSEDVNYLSRPSPGGTVRMDPHSCGRNFADPPLWLPREYFLRALTARMEQVKQEWSNSVSRLLQDTEPYVYSFTRQDTRIGRTDELNMTQQKGFKWTVRVLRQFTNLLSKTITAWETFKDGEIRYFYNSQGEDAAGKPWGTYLASIDKDVTELKDLRSSLQYQTDLFENMTTNLVTHAQHAEAIITREQSKFIQALTVITIFYLPPTLAATIFSMQTILPSNVKFKDWIYTLVALFVSTAVLVLNLSNLAQLARWCRSGLKLSWRFLRSIRWRPTWERSDNDEFEMGDPGGQEDDAGAGAV